MYSAKKASLAALLLLLLSCWACPSSSQRPGSETQAVPPDKPACTDIIDAWQAIEGHPYVWGGESIEEGGFDCSGAIYHVQKTIGRPVPRTTSRKYHIMAAGPETHWSNAPCGAWTWWTLNPSRPYGHIGMITLTPRAWQSGSSTGPTQIHFAPAGFWDQRFAVSKTPAF